MRILKIVGVASSAAVILLSATVVSAEGRAPNALRQNRDDYRKAASTTPRVTAGREEEKGRAEEARKKAGERLADIQDKVKQRQAQQLAARFENLNKTWTEHFMNLLDRYGIILGKIKGRADIAAGKGKDVTAANAAIQSAKTAIANARTAVAAQAAKTYVPDISAAAATATTTPSGQEGLIKDVRASFKNLRASLFKDLFALRDGPMRDARKAVQDALQALGAIPGVDEDSATSTPTSN
ncbi:hypothetical protein HY972_01480 [Candidatus Kaiserbacteria bacterium]|nr:hypothetical protein [Candidatus Kaiserbacteria bacterium]